MRNATLYFLNVVRSECRRGLKGVEALLDAQWSVKLFFLFYFIFVLFELLLHLEGRNTDKKDRFKRIDSIDRPEGDDIKGILFKLVHHGIVIWNTLKRHKNLFVFSAWHISRKETPFCR